MRTIASKQAVAHTRGDRNSHEDCSGKSYAFNSKVDRRNDGQFWNFDQIKKKQQHFFSHVQWKKGIKTTTGL